MWLDRCIVLVYVGILVWLGLRGSRGMKNAGDFTASGNRYGAPVIFATLAASYIGGGYSSGNAAAAFETGIGTTVTLFGFSLSMIGVGLFLVKGIRRFDGCTTVGGVIGQSYGRAARILTGLFSFVCCIGVIGAQVETMGLVFQTLFGIPARLGAVIGCSVVLFYSTFGGLQSVIAADVTQFVLLAVGMPLLLVMGLSKAGGIGEVLAAVPSSHFDPFNGTTPIGFFSMLFTMAFGEMLAPPYMQRLLIGKNLKATAQGTVASGIFSIPFFIITCLIGLTAYAMGVTKEPASAMPALMLEVLPIGLRGLVMAAMVSIIMSASDSFLNGAAVSLVCDVIRPLYPSLSDRNELRWLQWSNAMIGAAALTVAFAVPNVFAILVLSYSFWSPLILVPLAAALLGVRSDGRTFRYALMAGLISTLVWNYAWGKPWGIDGAAVGMLANIWVFTWGTLRLRRYRTQRITLWKYH